MRESVMSHLAALKFYGGLFPPMRLAREAAAVALGGIASFPVTVNFLISDRCNLRCAMCPGEVRGARQAGDGQLSFTEITGFLSGLKRHRVLIHFGGGEPFARPDFPDIVRAAKAQGLRCLLTTNGSMTDGAGMEALAQARVDAVIFSVYGSEQTHDAVTGVPGSYRKLMSNLGVLLSKRKRGTRVFASTLFLPSTVHAAVDLVGFLRRQGVDGVKVEHLNFLLDGENGCGGAAAPFDLTPSVFTVGSGFDERFIGELGEVLGNLRGKFGDFVYIKPRLDGRGLHGWYSGGPGGRGRCLFIRHSVFVDYNGNVIPCQFFKSCVIGNIRNNSLKDIWASEAYGEIRRTIAGHIPAVCARCCKN